MKNIKVILFAGAFFCFYSSDCKVSIKAIKEKTAELRKKLGNAKKLHCFASSIAENVSSMAENQREFFGDIKYCHKAFGNANIDEKECSVVRSKYDSTLKGMINGAIRKSRQSLDSVQKGLSKLSKIRLSDERQLSDKSDKELARLSKNLEKACEKASEYIAQSSKLGKELYSQKAKIMAMEKKEEILACLSPVKVKKDKPSDYAVAKVQDQPKVEEKINSEEVSSVVALDSYKPLVDDKNSQLSLLDEQIKTLSESIAALSSNIDEQLENLERFTKEMVDEALVKVSV